MTRWSEPTFRAASTMFWLDDGNAATLISGLNYYLKQTRTDPATMYGQVDNIAKTTLLLKDKKLLVSDRTFRNMLVKPPKTARDTSRPFYSLVLLTLCHHMGYGIDDLDRNAEAPGHKGKLAGSEHAEVIQAFKALGQAFCRACAEHAEPAPARASGDIFSHAETLMRGHFSASAIIEQFYLTDSPEEHAHFETFRYGAEPGTIERAFLAVCKPTQEGFPCTFAHCHALADGGKAKSVRRGIIMWFGNDIAFVGGSTDAGWQAAEVLLVPKRNHIDDIDGLILTTDDHSNQLASRIVLARSTDTHHGLQHSTHKAADVFAEFPDLNLHERLRNEIDFKFDQPVRYGGKVINEKKLVVSVEEMLGDQFMLENGEIFNPADSAQYTFNAALKRKRRLGRGAPGG